MDNQKRTSITEIETRLEELQVEKEKLLKAASEIEGEFLSSYEIRPAGRHVLTIGEDLIQDQYAAIVELVKNCYDADSPDAMIVFRKILENNCLEIRVEDHGHGMTTKDVINKWLVPSTDYKLGTRKSPLGRTMQGRKGIGRYAASILGSDLKLQTVDAFGIETTLYLQWSQLAKYQYLDQIRVPIKTRQTDKETGTVLTMHSLLSENNYWTDKAFKKLRFELKKLIPPRGEGLFDDNFKITLTFDNFFSDDTDNVSETIKPYPILDFYDYRICGHISADGFATLKYENKKVKNSVAEQIELNYGITGCGALAIDIRVYDRDKDAIDQLISRGLQDENGDYVTKQQARQLLNDVNGIGVYRNGFRIRPLGDADFDWLKLNEQRVQNPSMKIGSNQVVGYVHVESEEISGLEEKSARDGLKNNVAYEALKKITCAVILELEQRRFIFRRKLGLLKPGKKLERQLEGLYDYAPLKRSVSKTLERAGMPTEVIEEITDIISKEENKKNKAIEEIKRAVAVYQGQATLGKIINIILHEGRRPLNYFRNQIPNLNFYGERFAQKKDESSYSEIVRLTKGLSDNAEVFVSLFRKLDPLSAKRRETQSEFSMYEALNGAVDVYSKECLDNGIRIDFECPNDIKFVGWEQDIYTIMVNLLDNSLFWIVEKKCIERRIEIVVSKTNGGFTLNYTDSGPGISDELLESGVIFDPEFTTKPHGTGLGLAIAGEAATRNRLILTAVQNDKGAHFILSANE
ncbi:ATP-binding protein [Blautia sp.]